MVHSVENTTKVHESMDLGLKFHTGSSYVIWTTYLNFCAPVFSSVKWAESYQSLSCDKVESFMLRVLPASRRIVNAQQMWLF